MIEPDDVFSLLSDQTRLRIILLLEQEGDLCVCEIMFALDESQPKVSRHLAHMRQSGLVSSRREGTWMHYQINPALPAWAKKIITETSRQLAGHENFRQDLENLHAMSDRPGVKCA